MAPWALGCLWACLWSDGGRGVGDFRACAGAVCVCVCPSEVPVTAALSGPMFDLQPPQRRGLVGLRHRGGESCLD